MNLSPYALNPDRVRTESETRWLSWNFLVRAGKKHNFQGIAPEEVAKRRKKGKAQRAARKANR